MRVTAASSEGWEMADLRAAKRMASTAATAGGGGEGGAGEWTWSRAVESGGMERRKVRLAVRAEEGEGRQGGGDGRRVEGEARMLAAEECDGAGRGWVGWRLYEWRLR